MFQFNLRTITLYPCFAVNVLTYSPTTLNAVSDHEVRASGTLTMRTPMPSVDFRTSSYDLSSLCDFVVMRFVPIRSGEWGCLLMTGQLHRCAVGCSGAIEGNERSDLMRRALNLGYLTCIVVSRAECSLMGDAKPGSSSTYQWDTVWWGCRPKKCVYC